MMLLKSSSSCFPYLAETSRCAELYLAASISPYFFCTCLSCCRSILLPTTTLTASGI